MSGTILQDICAWREAANMPAVVVTIDSAKGSVPRAAGTKMLVTADRVIGTIGGGHLEYTAIDVARRQLAQGGVDQRQRFVLGASLGQCCGGVANVTFETITPADVESADAIERWFTDATVASGFPIVLFGAGHVGRAVATVVGLVPCSVTWVDTRDDAFPAAIPPNIRAIVTDAPESEVDAAPAGASFLVMTHLHPLDEALTQRILARNDFAYFGLIGSVSKRRQFERRLIARGTDPLAFARMRCPIGIGGIDGKEPGVIAVAVAAELLREHARWVDAPGRDANASDAMTAASRGTR